MFLSTRDAIDMFGMPILEMPLVKLVVIPWEGRGAGKDEGFILNIVEIFSFLSIFRGFLSLISEKSGELLAIIDTDKRVIYQIDDSELVLPDCIVFYPLDKTTLN